jgi:ubiquinone/menaquinone biosynthesis C-methylase UbiE
MLHLILASLLKIERVSLPFSSTFSPDQCFCWHSAIFMLFLSGNVSMTQEDVTRQQFDLTAKAYSTAPLFVQGHDLTLMVEVAKPVHSWHVLDIGCGAGHTTFAFAPYVQQIVGIDLSPGMLLEAQQNLQRRGLANVHFQQASVTALPFANEEFDLVTCRFVAHHFSSLSPALSEIRRVLKQEGQLLAVDVISPEPDNLAQFINHIERLRDPSHFWEWKISQWQAAMHEVGMSFNLLHQWRLPIDFEDWTTRQQTPLPVVEELKGLLDSAPKPIQTSLQLENQPRRAFQLWAALMKGVPV